MKNTLQVKKLSKTVIQRTTGYFRISEKGTGLIFQFSRAKTAANSGSFYVVHKRKWINLGSFPALTIEEARNKASAIQLKLNRNPELPSALALIEITNVSDVLNLYLKSIEIDASIASNSRTKNIKSVINNQLLPLIGQHKALDVSTYLVYEKVYENMRKNDYSLSYISISIRTLATAYRAAKKLGAISKNPLSTLKFSSLTSIEVKPKSMSIETYELKNAFAAIKKKRCIKTRMMCVMMLLFGSRLEETTMITWSKIDIEKRQWIIKEEDTKTASRHVLPLTDISIEVINKYKQLRRKTNNRGRYLFPGTLKNKQAMNKTYACRKISQDCKFTAHDFRKVARTWWQQNRVDYYIGEMLLNHSRGKTDKAYIQGELVESCRDALTKWHEHLVSIGIKECL